jgi:organic hydroperoxide reductase OsmC/OhrA
MLTQIVRYGRMLKVEFHAARCHVEAQWSSTGSVFAGTIGSTCHQVTTRVEIDSDDEPARVAALIRNAEGGCYAQSALQEPVKVVGEALLNGEPIDYEQYPRRVKRR